MPVKVSGFSYAVIRRGLGWGSFALDALPNGGGRLGECFGHTASFPVWMRGAAIPTAPRQLVGRIENQPRALTFGRGACV